MEYDDPKQTAADFPWGSNENPKTNPRKPLYVKMWNAFVIFPLFCPLLIWFGVKLKNLVEEGTVIRAEGAAGSKQREQPNPPHKQQENEHQWSRVCRLGQPVGWHGC